MPRPVFPKTLKQFREQFSDDGTCFQYLVQSRWPEGFVCPHCGGHQFWMESRRRLYECRVCSYQASATAGTILHGSHISIQEWFWAAYLVATHTPGMSAKQLQRQMGCSYKTAWSLLHRLRCAMVNEARTKLHGTIEADETIIGGPVRDKRGRGVIRAATNTLVFGAVEVITYADKNGVRAEKAGRLRLATTQSADEKSIKQFLNQNVERGSTIRTDGWKGYSKTALAGYRHESNPGVIARHIHRAFGNLKTWLNGTHHGVDPAYLHIYLDEFVFRFNRRKTPMAAFQTLLGLASTKAPVSYKKFTQPESKG